jgi:glutathione S-transferase
VVLGSTLRWGTMFNLIPQRPEFQAYIARLGERPALQRAEAKDEGLKAA